MTLTLRPRTLLLFTGDILSLTAALWLSLYLRSWEAPTSEFFFAHLVPFSLLFVAWIAVFFIAGLYESRALLLARRALSQTLLVAQSINILLAALFFFFVPLFLVAPKTVLFIYLVVSFLLILAWRAALFPRLGMQKPEPALLLGRNAEVEELDRALGHAHRAPVIIVERLTVEDGFADLIPEAVSRFSPRFIIADFNDPTIASLSPSLYNYLSQGIRFLDAGALYEEIFGRIPLSSLDSRWLARNAHRYAHLLYDPLKRVMDILVGLLSGLLSIVLYPFIAAAIYIESGFPVFIVQERVGQDGKIIRLYKFRSMSGNDSGEYREGASRLQVTSVGKILRGTRLDELPQLWSVVRGDLSLIGPRPELPALVALYQKEIPFYGVRHLIKPGLSGWAQLYHDNHPHHEAAVEATKEKLSYDLYYLKHRSLLLDGIIALKTIKKLLTRSGV